LVWRGEVDVRVEEDDGDGFEVEAEEVGVDEEGSSWAIIVTVDEVEEVEELSWARSFPLLLVAAPVFEWADDSKEAAFVNALKEHPAKSFVIDDDDDDDGDTPFSFSFSFSSPLSLSLSFSSPLSTFLSFSFLPFSFPSPLPIPNRCPPSSALAGWNVTLGL
jgi:hypothetical protein